MAATAAITGYGSKIGHATTSGGAPTYVAEVVNIPVPDEESADVKASHLQSDDHRHEYVEGFIEPGMLEVTANHTANEYETLKGIKDARSKLYWTISIPDMPATPSTVKGLGYIKKISGPVLDENLTTFKFTIKCSGKWTYTKGT
jgi:hypothetical protein